MALFDCKVDCHAERIDMQGTEENIFKHGNVLACTQRADYPIRQTHTICAAASPKEISAHYRCADSRSNKFAGEFRQTIDVSRGNRSFFVRTWSVVNLIGR